MHAHRHHGDHMLPVLDLSTYGNVRTKLTWVVSVLLAILEFVSLTCLLTPGQRISFLDLVDQMGLGKVASIAGIVVANQVVAWVVVTALRAHEVWDMYINRWRRRYDAAILTALLGQSLERTDVREVISLHPNRAMGALFYPFVSDSGPLIDKRLVVRFYEAIQTYWACRWIELSLSLAGIEIIGLAILDHIQGLNWTYLPCWLGLLVCSALVTEFALRRRVAPRVTAATIDEIHAIRAGHLAELDTRLAELLEQIKQGRIGGFDVPNDRSWG